MRISDWISDVCSSDLADIKGQRPAIAVGKVFEPRHRRALKALRNHLIEREQATLARARRVRESNRWRIEPRGARAVSGTGRAMAHGTIFRVKLRAAREVGSRSQMGKAQVGTPVTDAHLVCRRLLEKTKSTLLKYL